MKNKKGFSRCANDYIGRLREEGRYSTAHVYQSAIFRSVSFVVRVMCRSDKLLVSVCGFTRSTFVSVA